MSAITFAFDPTVSFRPSSWISPSTKPSISRSSVPEMSPFTRRLAPSHPVSWSAIVSTGFLVSAGLLGSVPFLLHIGPSCEHNTAQIFHALHGEHLHGRHRRTSLRCVSGRGWRVPARFSVAQNPTPSRPGQQGVASLVGVYPALSRKLVMTLEAQRNCTKLHTRTFHDPQNHP